MLANSRTSELLCHCMEVTRPLGTAEGVLLCAWWTRCGAGRYPVAGSSSGEYLPVATTRPETILGDTAVAVNPKDERWARRHAFVAACAST
jgi:hypothetical protein